MIWISRILIRLRQGYGGLAAEVLAHGQYGDQDIKGRSF
jgi:hypothetical protein